MGACLRSAWALGWLCLWGPALAEMLGVTGRAGCSGRMSVHGGWYTDLLSVLELTPAQPLRSGQAGVGEGLGRGGGRTPSSRTALGRTRGTCAPLLPFTSSPLCRGGEASEYGDERKSPHLSLSPCGPHSSSTSLAHVCLLSAGPVSPFLLSTLPGLTEPAPIGQASSAPRKKLPLKKRTNHRRLALGSG